MKTQSVNIILSVMVSIFIAEQGWVDTVTHLLCPHPLQKSHTFWLKHRLNLCNEIYSAVSVISQHITFLSDQKFCHQRISIFRHLYPFLVTEIEFLENAIQNVFLKNSSMKELFLHNRFSYSRLVFSM